MKTHGKKYEAAAKNREFGQAYPSKQALEIVTDPPAWLGWPGRWGDTQPLLPGGLHQPSPTGPCVHRQWRDPDAGGHFMPLEEPETVAEQLRAFFRPLRAGH